MIRISFHEPLTITGRIRRKIKSRCSNTSKQVDFYSLAKANLSSIYGSTVEGRKMKNKCDYDHKSCFGCIHEDKPITSEDCYRKGVYK